MNVIVCQDARSRSLDKIATQSQLDAISVDPALREQIREQANRDFLLVQLLRDRGRGVRLFDCYEDDLITKIKDPVRGATRLGEMITSFGAKGLIFDLAYHGDFELGMKMLHELQIGGIRHMLERIVVVSWFTDEKEHKYPHRLMTEFNVDRERIRYAFRLTHDEISNLLD